MAVEVDDASHFFRPRDLLPPSRKNRLDRWMKVNADGTLQVEKALSESSEESLSKSTDSSRPQFNYNQLHDLESLWWLSTYYVLEWARKYAEQYPMDSREQRRIAELRTLTTKLFDQYADRRKAICETGEFASKLRSLPGTVRRAGEALEQWRLQLVDCYITSEKDTEAVRNPDFAGLHDSFTATMNTIVELISSPQAQPQVSCDGSKKRARDPDDVAGSSKKPRVA